MDNKGKMKQYYVAFVKVLLGLVAFSCCVAAEFKRGKAKDIRIDGNLCSLPQTPAYGLGIAAALCLAGFQLIGTSTVGVQLCSRQGRSGKRPVGPIVLLVLSWVNYILAIILISTSTSMNRRQAYGRGWLDGQCYFVKPGVFLGSALLVITNMLLIFGLSFASAKFQSCNFEVEEATPYITNTSKHNGMVSSAA